MTISVDGKKTGEYTEVKEVRVTSDNLSKNKQLCSMLESGWILLEVRVEEHRGSGGSGNAIYTYFLGKPPGLSN